MKRDPLNLIVSGIGGQGNILIARLLGRLFSGKDYFVTIGETFGAAQRGGSVFSSLRISQNKEHGPLIPEGQAHVVLGLEPLETLRMLSRFGNSEVSTLTNDREVFPVDVLGGRDKYPDKGKLLSAIKTISQSAWVVPATRIAVELKAPIVTNMVMLGALVGSGVLPIGLDEVQERIKSDLPSGKLDINLKGFEEGYKQTSGGV
ncbi:MAG: indolepyruvate oxidoreductase subunit beta [Desulfarculaceae bacterium]|jgi:indolepyruvate ferredoxin oxidoreductase beta subunit